MFEDFMEQCLGIHNKKLQKELSDVAKLRTFFKGENLIRVEDKTKEVFLLMDGIVRGYFLKDDGRDFTDCFLFSGRNADYWRRRDGHAGKTEYGGAE